MDAVSTRRRDRYDIVAEILEASREGTLRTHLMSRASLSSRQITEYVPLLVQKGFLERVGVVHDGRFRRMIKTTRKGMELLGSLTSLYTLLLPHKAFQAQWLQNSKSLAYERTRQ